MNTLRRTFRNDNVRSPDRVDRKVVVEYNLPHDLLDACLGVGQNMGMPSMFAPPVEINRNNHLAIGSFLISCILGTGIDMLRNGDGLFDYEDVEVSNIDPEEVATAISSDESIVETVIRSFGFTGRTFDIDEEDQTMDFNITYEQALDLIHLLELDDKLVNDMKKASSFSCHFVDTKSLCIEMC